MSYEKFQKALDILDISSRVSHAELKKRYQKLSKELHPDMPNGDEQRFREINEAYKIVETYMKNFRFRLDEEEFYEQNPFSKKSKDWFYNF